MSLDFFVSSQSEIELHPSIWITFHTNMTNL